jgi:hypothetical protein
VEQRRIKRPRRRSQRPPVKPPEYLVKGLHRKRTRGLREGVEGVVEEAHGLKREGEGQDLHAQDGEQGYDLRSVGGCDAFWVGEILADGV